MSDTLMISVSGMRGHVGTDLTPELVARHAAALGAWVRSSGARSTVILGRDSRTSGPMFARAAAAGLMSVGVDVVDLGVVPTPTVQMAVEHHHAGAGLILTASHNPIEWNALKFVGPDGIFLDADSGARVRALAEKGPPRAGWDGLGTVREDPDAVSRHLDAVLALPVIDVAAIRQRGFHVALDCVRGAGAVAMLPLLERLGCRVSGINLEADGRFPRPPEPVPENLGELGRTVREKGADLGLAVDPDVDRLAVVDERGRAIGEDYTLAFAVRAVLDGRGSEAKNPKVVVNLSTSLVVDDAARAVGATVIRAAVGEANVARAIRDQGAADRRGGQRGRHVPGASHRARRTPGGGLDLASPCHFRGNGRSAGRRLPSLHHREGQGTAGSRAGSPVRPAAAAIRRRDRGRPGWTPAVMGRPLAPCATVRHGTNRSTDRRSAHDV